MLWDPASNFSDKPLESLNLREADQRYALRAEHAHSTSATARTRPFRGGRRVEGAISVSQGAKPAVTGTLKFAATGGAGFNLRTLGLCGVVEIVAKIRGYQKHVFAYVCVCTAPSGA